MSVTTDTFSPGTAPSGALSAPTTQPVDRGRRFRFVSGVVAFCLVMAALFTAFAAFGMFVLTYGTLIEMFVGGMLSLATATTLAYITGSVVDYNGGVANVFTRNNRPVAASEYILPEAKG